MNFYALWSCEILKFILPLSFVLVPIAEIATFIKVGNIIGLWPTIATIILTAIIGAALIRHQGWKVMADAQRATNEGRLPIDAVVDGVFLLVAALMLLTPGFITDGFGFLLLWQPLRLSLAKWIWARIKSSEHVRIYPGEEVLKRPGSQNTGQTLDKNGPIIEGEVIHTAKKNSHPDSNKSDKPDPRIKSPWTKGNLD